MANHTTLPNASEHAPSPAAHASSTPPGPAIELKPIFSPQDPRPVALSSAAGIAFPIILSAAGLLVVLLGGWTQPLFLAMASIAAVYSLFLSARIALRRLKHQPVKPGWVAGVIVLTVYLGPATAVVGFVRLLNHLTGVFDKALVAASNPDAPRRALLTFDPTVNDLSALLLWICAPAFIIGCAVFWLEVVALRFRLYEIENALRLPHRSA